MSTKLIITLVVLFEIAVPVLTVLAFEWLNPIIEESPLTWDE